MANVRQRWTKLLGPIKREFLALKDSEIDELYAGFMVCSNTPSFRAIERCMPTAVARRARAGLKIDAVLVPELDSSPT